MSVVKLINFLGIGLRQVAGLFSGGLAKNAVSLYLLHFANYALPLVTMPYLVRVLGPDNFGVVAFGQSLLSYFMLVVNYGFDWSATRAISVNRDNPEQVGRIAFAVWAAKFLLAGLGFLALIALLLLLPQLNQFSTLLYVLYGIVIGNVLFPQWLFQGLERMVTFSVISLVVKVLVTFAVFIFVNEPEDHLVYAALLSAYWLGVGVWAFFWSVFGFRLPIVFPKWGDIIQVLVEGWTVFLSTAATSLYTTGNAFLLGILSNDSAVVGYYSAAERVVKAFQGLVSPLSQVFYPRISIGAARSREEGLRWARVAMIYMGGMGTMISVALLMGAPLITKILLGPQYEPSVQVMRVLSLLPFLIALSNVFGVQIMLSFRQDQAFLMILLTAGLVNLLLALVLVPPWQALGMAMAVTLAEFYVTARMFLFLIGKKLLP